MYIPKYAVTIFKLFSQTVIFSSRLECNFGGLLAQLAYVGVYRFNSLVQKIAISHEMLLLFSLLLFR